MFGSEKSEKCLIYLRFMDRARGYYLSFSRATSFKRVTGENKDTTGKCELFS